MPFVKKNDTQDPRPSSPFVGRADEILFFVHNILQPDAPAHNILSISGQGGVGKSTLLARFIAEAHKTSFKDYCLTAIVDERQATLVDMMEQFAQQLHLTGIFAKVLKQYKEALRRQHIERETFSHTLFENAPDIAGAVVEGIPVAGPLLREGAKVVARHLLKEDQVSQLPPRATFLELSLDDLTKGFVTELNRLADAKITLGSTRKKRERRVVLFFDTFEQLAAEITPWLLDHFLATQVSSNVVLVVAGRDPIEHTSPDDPKRWLPYCDDGTIYWIPLNSFTEEEARVYLVKRGISDADQIVNIWHLSQGLPLYLSLLTSNPHGDIDPTKDVVVNFLRWIPEQEAIKRQLALDAALFSMPFNQDDLEAFASVPKSERASLYQWLTEQPFVRSRSQDGRYLYHDVARDLFRRHLYQQSPKHYYTVRRGLAVYYQALLEKIQDQEGQEIYHSEEWLELLLAVVYQLILLPDPTSHIKAMEFVLDDEYTNEEQDKEITGLLRTISQGSFINFTSSSARQRVVALLHYRERSSDSRGKQESLNAINSLLEQVIHEPSVPHELLSVLYQKRGWTYFYGHKVHEYQQALADFTRAIELNPKNAVSYKGRGWTYRNLAYRNASDAVKINLGEACQAIEDLNLALNLDPRLVYVYYALGDIHLSLREYQKALTSYNLEIKRVPESDSGIRAYIYWKRGYIYLCLKDLEQAQADLTQSYELETQRVDSALMAEWAGLCQKAADPNLSGRLEAITRADLQSYTAYTCRGIVLLLQRHWKEALAELEQALLQKPSWREDVRLRGAHFWKGMACAFLEQDEEAIAAIEKALDSELPPILLAPLRWFEQERPDFYEKHVVPLLAKHK